MKQMNFDESKSRISEGFNLKKDRAKEIEKIATHLVIDNTNFIKTVNEIFRKFKKDNERFYAILSLGNAWRLLKFKDKKQKGYNK